jgi:hypothetical protein
MMRQWLYIFIVANLLASVAMADEGMWPYNLIPKEALKEKYNFSLEDGWLNRSMHASVRFNNGGSGSFVSDQGLVMTNHHVGADCIQKLSQGSLDIMRDGFLARSPDEEQKCPDLELNQLRGIQDVTEQVLAAAAALPKKSTDKQRNDIRKEKIAKIEKACHEQTGLRCDVVTLYSGGAYHLYRYKKYTDVRLVFAPEFQAAFFGGDPDNFTFPRMCLDVAFFRVYDNAKPVSSLHHFPFSRKGVEEGELVFVSGHPGSTGRFSTTRELLHLRDVAYPYLLDGLQTKRAMLKSYMEQGEAQEKAARDDFFGVENSIKALGGFLAGLKDPTLMQEAQRRQDDVKQRLSHLPKAEQKRLKKAWPQLKIAYDRYDTFYKQYIVSERYFSPGGDLTSIARHLLRVAEERPKANEKRLPEYTDSSLKSLELRLFSEAPIDMALEAEKISFGLEQMVAVLGPKHPVVKKALAGASPQARSKELTRTTKLLDIGVRRDLYAKDKKKLKAAKDPLIEFVRTYDKFARKNRKRYEDQVESLKRAYEGRIAEAWAKAYGEAVYPDATFSLRLSYGVVRGYPEDGKSISWKTQMGDLYRKNKQAQNKQPYEMATAWHEAASRIDFSTPFNFVSTNDIIGGNSGSPVLNQKGEVVGLIFDGNIHQLPNRFLYRDTKERAVSVDAQGILHALARVYRAEQLLTELKSPSATE